jgi:hypothetical protein
VRGIVVFDLDNPLIDAVGVGGGIDGNGRRPVDFPEVVLVDPELTDVDGEPAAEREGVGGIRSAGIFFFSFEGVFGVGGIAALDVVFIGVSGRVTGTVIGTAYSGAAGAIGLAGGATAVALAGVRGAAVETFAGVDAAAEDLIGVGGLGTAAETFLFSGAEGSGGGIMNTGIGGCFGLAECGFGGRPAVFGSSPS